MRPTRRSPLVAGLALALVPLWWHVDLVSRGGDGLIAVFTEVGIYPTDVCLAWLAIFGFGRLAAVDRSRWLVVGSAVLIVGALASARGSRDPLLAIGLAGHLLLLSLACAGVEAAHVPRAALALALVGSAVVQSLLATAQFALQQPLVPAFLHLPWLPIDPARAGAPVVLGATGTRLLRGFGTFPHPNVLGGFLALALVCLPMLGRRWRRATPVWWLLGGIIGLGLLVSFCRAGWLAAGVGLGAWWWIDARAGRSHRWAVVGIGLALVGVACSPVAPILNARLLPLSGGSNALERGSIGNRLVLDRDALAEIVRHLPLGAGGGNYGLVAVADGYQQGWGEPPPNAPLLITAELGLPGLAALALLGLGTARAVRGRGRLDVAVLASCLVLLVSSMLDHYLWTMPLGRVIAWAPFALMAAVPRMDRPGDQPGIVRART